MSAVADMTVGDVAALVVRKHELDAELRSVRQQIKMWAGNHVQPIAVQIDDNIVTIRKSPYTGGMPQTQVIPLMGLGCSS